jgi:hypothetical protein
LCKSHIPDKHEYCLDDDQFFHLQHKINNCIELIFTYLRPPELPEEPPDRDEPEEELPPEWDDEDPPEEPDRDGAE